MPYRDQVVIPWEELLIIDREGYPENPMSPPSATAQNDASVSVQPPAVVPGNAENPSGIETVSGFLRSRDYSNPMSISANSSHMNPGSDGGSQTVSYTSSLPQPGRNTDNSTESMDMENTDTERQGGGGLNSSTMNELVFYDGSGSVHGSTDR